MQSGTAERKTGSRKRRRPREFSKGALTPCTPSHLLPSTTPLTYAVQIEWLTSISWLISSSSFPTPPSMICDKAFHDVEDFGLDKIKKRLIECLAAVHLKELDAEKEAWEVPANISAKTWIRLSRGWVYCWTTRISALVLIQDCRCGMGEEQSLKDRVGHFLSFHDHVLKLANHHR